MSPERANPTASIQHFPMPPGIYTNPDGSVNVELERHKLGAMESFFVANGRNDPSPVMLARYQQQQLAEENRTRVRELNFQLSTRNLEHDNSLLRRDIAELQKALSGKDTQLEDRRANTEHCNNVIRTLQEQHAKDIANL